MVKNNIRKTQFESEMKDFISLIKKHEQLKEMCRTYLSII